MFFDDNSLILALAKSLYSLAIKITVFGIPFIRVINTRRTFSNRRNLNLILNKNGCPNHSSYDLTLHLFPFRVCPLILFSSLFYSVIHFVKGLIKTDHDYTRVSSTMQLCHVLSILLSFMLFSGDHKCC